MLLSWSQIMFQHECNGKFNSGVFKLWICHKICVQKPILYNTGEGTALVFRLSLSIYTPLWVSMLVGIPGYVKTPYASSEIELITSHPTWCPKRVKGICVGDFLGLSLSPFLLKMPSVTHSIPTPGLTRQVHAETAARDLHSHLQDLSMQW